MNDSKYYILKVNTIFQTYLHKIYLFPKIYSFSCFDLEGYKYQITTFKIFFYL